MQRGDDVAGKFREGDVENWADVRHRLGPRLIVVGDRRDFCASGRLGPGLASRGAQLVEGLKLAEAEQFQRRRASAIVGNVIELADLVEKGGFIWLWPGAAELADPAKLPDCHAFGLDRPDWTAKPYLMLEIKSNYSLLFENLLDTSHISFLHGTALDGGRMASSSFRLESEEKTVRLIRELKGDTPTPSNTKQYGLHGVTIFDRRLESIAYLPNLHIIRNTFTFPERPGHPPHVRINVMPITPSRPNELYQFLTMTASYPETHPVELVEGMRSVLDEDRVVLEAIQDLYDENGSDLPEWSVNADVAGLRARRKLAELAAIA